MKSVAIIALVLAVFTVQQVSANWSNSSNSTNTSSVTVIFEASGIAHLCKVSAHFNHQDDVIIQVSAPNSSNSSSPMLNLTNLAGYFGIENATSILSVIGHTNSSTTYKFRYWGVFTANRPCALTNSTMTCRFNLWMPAIQQTTDLYFTFDDPNHSYLPEIKIVGAGYDNVTWYQEGIYVRQVNYTENLKRYINVTLTGDYYNQDKVRYLNWNASNFNASWMMSNLKPMYLGFQCWGAKDINIIANWTGEDGIYINTPVNLSKAGVPFDDNYHCWMTIVFTERSNNHALIPIQISGRIEINGSSSNHSNGTTEKWAVFAGSNKGCTITSQFTQWDGVDLTLEAFAWNQSVPSLNLTNYAGYYPFYINSTKIFRVVNRTNRSITYRFNYWDAIGSNGPCISYANYSVGCRFKLWMGDLTDIFVTISNPFIERNIQIFGSGYNNATYDKHWIDANEADYTQYLLRFVNLTIESDYFSKSPVRYLNWNASNFNASWMMATLKPVALGFQCTEHFNGSYLNIIANFTGEDGFYSQTPVNLTRAGLPTYGHWACNMSVIATERGINHAMIQINVRNIFYLNNTGNYSGYWNGPQQRSNFSEYRPIERTDYYSNQTYYNYTYYNSTRNSSHKHGNASWYSHENPYYWNNQTEYNQSRYNNQTYYYNNTGYNYSYYNQSRFNNQTYYNNSGYNHTYYNQSRYYNQTYSYNNSGYNSSYYNYGNQSWRDYQDIYYYNSTNNTYNTSYRGDFCDQYENRLNPTCLEQKVQHAKFMNKILIGCVAVLAVGLLLLACKVCCGEKKPNSRDNSPQNTYIEFGNTSTARDPQMVIHNPAPTQQMPTIVPATPAYLIGGHDGAKFMVIPQKV